MVSLALLIFIYQIFAKKWKHVSVGILFRGDKKQRHNDYWWGRWIGQEYTAISISGRDHWLITSAALGQFTFCRIILCIWQYCHLDLDLDQGYPPSSATITILRKPQDTTLVIFSQNGVFLWCCDTFLISCKANLECRCWWLYTGPGHISLDKISKTLSCQSKTSNNANPHDICSHLTPPGCQLNDAGFHRKF